METQIRSNEDGMGQKGRGMERGEVAGMREEERERGTKLGEIQIRGGLLV